MSPIEDVFEAAIAPNFAFVDSFRVVSFAFLESVCKQFLWNLAFAEVAKLIHKLLLNVSKSFGYFDLRTFNA